MKHLTLAAAITIALFGALPCLMLVLQAAFWLATGGTLFSVIRDGGVVWFFSAMLWSMLVLPICLFIATDMTRDI